MRISPARSSPTPLSHPYQVRMFRFAQITDHHLPHSQSAAVCGYASANTLRAVRNHSAEHHANFLVFTGDRVHKGIASQ